MVDVIEQLQAYDIPHTSYMHAIRHMGEEYTDMSVEATHEMIKNLTGKTPLFIRKDDLDIFSHYVLLYIVQEAIRYSHDHKQVMGDDVLPIAVEKAEKFIKENPWVFAKPEEEEVIDPTTGKAKMKKGKKQELAIELYEQHRGEDKEVIMEVFQKELDMSKSGARTYYYNMRKKFGDDK